MVKLAVAVEYKGTCYKGWQKQENCQTLEATIKKALGRVANHPVNLVVAGRTDKGVHACQQVFHFESTSKRDEYNWLTGANSHLPADIRLLWVAPVADDFHARFSAQYRRYIYLIYNHRSEPSLLREYCDWQYLPLDVTAMAQAASALVGRHDFAAFRSSDCQAKSSYRTVHLADISKHGNWIHFDIQANAFLYKMVRMLVAELLVIGAGRKQPEHITELLNTKCRKQKPVAKPSGLFLCEVGYSKKWQLPTISTRKLWLYNLGKMFY